MEPKPKAANINIAAVFDTYVNTITAAETRRQRYLSLFFAYCGASLAVLGSDIDIAPLWLVAPLAIISWVTFSKIRFLKKIAQAKFLVIEKLEKDLGISPFRDEWKHFNDSISFRLPFGLSDLEMIVPFISASISSIACILIVASWF